MAQIWKYNGSTWTQVNADSFGDPNTYTIETLWVHNNNLYAGTGTVGGAKVWRWNGSRWAAVSSTGFGNVNNIMISSFETFNNKLYAGTGSFSGPDPSSIWSWQSIDISPIYRFWNNTARHHFYTVSASEKDFVIANYPEWAYEGIAFYSSPTDHPDLDPVYRFWSERYRGHFYTISEAEKTYVQQNYANDWAYEGVAYYASPATVLDSMSLYRFWSNNYRSHFYTVSELERDYVIQNYSADWAYEGVGYQVF